MLISMMAAAALDGVIGVDNALPWRLPADLRRFRQHTTGKPIVMGRKTLASLGDKPLPKRTNIVVSRTLPPGARADGVVVVASLDDAFSAAGDAAEVVVVGGAALYAAALPRAERLLLTLVDARVAGDAFFPPIGEGWRIDVERSQLAIAADADNAWPTSFVDLWRPASAPPGSRPFSWDPAARRFSIGP